jgi:alpha-1,6-mannosyltransferase
VKIADISEFYSPTGGGVRTYVEEKFHAAARLGHELIVIAPGPEDKTEARPGGKLVWVKAPIHPLDSNYHIFWSAEPVWRVLDAEKPDLVEGSSPWRGGWLAAQWQGPAARALFMHADPVAVYPQTFLGGVLSTAKIDRLFGWFWSYLRRLNAHFDGCVVAGAWLAERFAARGLRHLHVVPFGVETAAFSPRLRDESLRAGMLARCGLGPDATLLLNVGRHHPEKRIGLLIDAVAKAQKMRPVGLYIVGDGLSHERVKRQAAKVPHVYVAGRESDRPKLASMMASADALLHGSTAETFGFVVAESLASGTPVIVPRAGGAGDLADPSYAELYEPGRSDDAARAILAFAQRDRAALSAQAVVAGQGVGDLGAHFDRLFALYAAMARRHVARASQPLLTPDAALADAYAA